MRSLWLRFAPPIVVIVLILALELAGASYWRTVLVLAVLFGIWPIAADILAEAVKRRRISLEAPVAVTIVIMLAVGSVRSAAVFVLLILVGQAFKEYIVWRVQRSVESIAEALPDTAHVRSDGAEVEVKISDIAAGQTVILKAGSRAPVDGILTVDLASFDESVVTGESRPVEKKRGDKLMAGAINAGGYAEMEASGTSENSTIAQVRRLVREAQSKAAPLSRFTDAYALATVVVAILLCLVLYLISHDLLRTLALWIALVPVIFAIIVPVSTTLGISVLAKRGILIKNAEAVENLTKVDTIAFDKTGTLTKGRPEVVGVSAAPGYDEADILKHAACVERLSEHPLAAAIVRRAGTADAALKAAEPEIFRGRGITAVCGDRRVSVGSRAFLAEAGVNIPAELAAAASAGEDGGGTAVFCAVDGAAAGLFVIADAVRPGIREVLDRLRGLGFRLVMITGDGARVAGAIAGSLGIEEVRAECLPQDKVRHIADLKKAGRRVAMVGDGINDAPALAEADVGIAMGLRGTDLTLESAQTVLVKDDLAVLPVAILASRRIFRVIRSDLYIASAIHLFGAALVAAGLVGILGSAFIHQASSVIILLNTFGLLRRASRKALA